MKRRLFWTGVIFALLLVWLTVQVLRIAEGVTSAMRRPFEPMRGRDPRLGPTEGRI